LQRCQTVPCEVRVEAEDTVDLNTALDPDLLDICRRDTETCGNSNCRNVPDMLRPAELPFHSTREELHPLLRPTELPCQSTREELQKFPLTVPTKSPTPCWPCRTSLSEYSRRAAELLRHGTHQTLHLCVTFAAVT
jgi:hypothetical protein